MFCGGGVSAKWVTGEEVAVAQEVGNEERDTGWVWKMGWGK